jgi:hypothetical protein
MQRSEYHSIQTQGRYRSDSHGRTGDLVRRDSDRVVTWYDPGPLLSEYGEEGWELAGIDGQRLLSKRARA